MTRDEAIKLLRGGWSGIRQWNAARQSRRFSLPGLRGLDLVEAHLWRANLSDVDLSGSNMGFAFLANCDLEKANLWGVNLEQANLVGADLSGANLSHANLRGAELVLANFERAYTIETNLRDTNLSSARLIGTSTFRSDFRGASMSGTVISCDLSEAVGLDSTVHTSRSSVSIETILGFGEEFPESFLRGCGLRDEEIAYFRSVVGRPIRCYSCFISYSTKDEEFAARLHNDFQAAGIRCWKWDHDARTGRPIWGEIDQAIRRHDKVVLIASENSLRSPAVNREIERAIQEEDRRIKEKQAGKFDGEVDVLFPVRVDNYLFDGWEHERKADVVKKVIGNARDWDKDPKVYAKVRDRLIKDLKADASRR